VHSAMNNLRLNAALRLLQTEATIDTSRSHCACFVESAGLVTLNPLASAMGNACRCYRAIPPVTRGLAGIQR